MPLDELPAGRLGELSPTREIWVVCGVGATGVLRHARPHATRLPRAEPLRGNANLRVVQPVWSKNSCGLTFVVFQEASKPFATPNRACTFCALADSRKEQDIAFSLMIALVMIMFYVLIEGPTTGPLLQTESPARDTPP